MSNCNKNEIMPIALAPLFTAAAGAIKQGREIKLQQASEGSKLFSAPKTLFGKLIGGVSGRTAAVEAQQMFKSDPVSQKVSGAMTTDKRTSPITGGFSFGGEAARKTYLPFAIVAAVVAAFYFMRKRGGRRRRY
jgi:hypothetical protein